MDYVVIFFLLGGLFFFTGGSIGILRLPDFYSRLHAAGKLDTMGAFMMSTGLFLYTLGHFSLDEVITGLKIVFIVVFISLASPTATHAIFDAGMKAGAPPWTKGKKRR
jgi:multicomponent Na+:H+ antiporter subunit G